jgi:hypothetical protein
MQKEPNEHSAGLPVPEHNIHGIGSPEYAGISGGDDEVIGGTDNPCGDIQAVAPFRIGDGQHAPSSCQEAHLPRSYRDRVATAIVMVHCSACQGRGRSTDGGSTVKLPDASTAREPSWHLAW